MRLAPKAFLILLVLLLCPPSVNAQTGPASVDVRSIVDQALRDYVRQSSDKVKGVTGVGSWIEGSRYRNPLTSPDPSDHDMTPIFDSRKMTKAQMAEEWKRMQAFMRQRIEQGLKAKLPGASPEQIKKVMRSVNIYPPDEIMADVVDEKEAVKRFAKLGAKPNLGGAPVEGIWGKAKKPFTQAYAESAGRTYFKDPNGVVRRGFADLDNLAAGYGKFQLQATNELCEQFAKKARLAMAEGRGADALKNLKRLNQYLRKAKNASGLSGFETMNHKLLQAIGNAEGLDAKDAETMARWLEDNQRLLRQGLSQADDQLLWLKEVASLDDAAKLKFIRGMSASKMRKFMSWAKGLQYKLNQAAGKGKAALGRVPWSKVFKAAVALGTAIELYNAASLYQSDGWAAANQSLSQAVINLIPSNILGQVMLDYATEVGYDMMAAHQDCLNLMAGIYEVKGRQYVGQGEQISELARRCVDEQCVTRALNKHAEAASRKQLDKESYAGVKGSRAIKARLMNQCLPVVLKAWKGERYALLTRVIKDKNKIDKLFSGAGMVLEAKAVKAGNEVEITARPQFLFSQGKLLSLLRQMESDLKLLGGPEKLGRLSIAENYEWVLQSFDYRQGRWLTKQRLPIQTKLIHPRDPRKKVLGDVEPFKMRLPKGPTYRVLLKYSQALAPGLAAEMDWRAPEVQEFRGLLRGVYGFRALAPLETARWRLAVAGPQILPAGAAGKLSAQVEGKPPWAGEPNFPTKIRWEKLPGRRGVGWGEQLAIKGPAKGQDTYRAVLMGTMAGKPVRLAEAIKIVSAQGAAWLRITARDSQTGQKLAQARWAVNGPGDFRARRGGAVLVLKQAAPGRYLIKVSAPQHQPLKGHLTLAAGKRYDKIAPLRLLLKQEGVLKVTVVTLTNGATRPVGGVKVKVASRDVNKSGLTGDNGVVVLRGIPADTYTVTAEKKGYKKFQKRSYSYTPVQSKNGQAWGRSLRIKIDQASPSQTARSRPAFGENWVYEGNAVYSITWHGVTCVDNAARLHITLRGGMQLEGRLTTNRTVSGPPGGPYKCESRRTSSDFGGEFKNGAFTFWGDHGVWVRGQYDQHDMQGRGVQTRRNIKVVDRIQFKIKCIKIERTH
jgi:hypothetical protein